MTINYAPQSLNCRGRLLSLARPIVMGILNLTPDSFSDGGKFHRPETALPRVETMLAEGAGIIDVGGYSTRPGAPDLTPEEELDRVLGITQEIVRRFPEAILSVDTFRAPVAKAMLEAGVHIVNDISGGQHDPEIYALAARYNAPYILMHIQGSPQTMQQNPQYANVVDDLQQYFVEKVNRARAAGLKDIVLDPGFGFGKTLAHNYELFRNLHKFPALGLPLMVGISRKSMIYRLIGGTPDDTAEMSAALHLQALRAGANILRVHNVKAAANVVKLYEALEHGIV